MRSGISRAAAFALVLPWLVVANAAAARAAGETCDGKPATMVISEEPTGPVVMGTDGDDVIVVTYDGYVGVVGGAGNDTICGNDKTWNIYGGEGTDDLWAGPHDTDVYPRLHGGPGDDVLHGNLGGTTLSGEDGNDTIVGRAGPDRISGGGGDDTLDGGGGNDFITDDAGNDTLDGGPGNDELAMGEEQGIPDGDLSPGPCPRYDVHLVVDVGAGTVSGLGDDTFQGFESYSTGWYDTTLLGSDGPDHLSTGFCGHTVIDSGGGDDHILAYADQGGSVSGGAGDDHIVLGSVQVVHAGLGDDTVVLSVIQDTYPTSWIGSHVDGSHGRDLLKASYVNEIDLRGRVTADYDTHGLGTFTATITDFEDATLRYPDGIDGNDPSEPEVIGTSGPNTLRASAPESGVSSAAVLKGLAGNDRLLGGPQDKARGGVGYDICRAQFMHGCEIRHRQG
jgi:Ca2+-binding RTX toxin-like protein